jgi:hypothetical protein
MPHVSRSRLARRARARRRPRPARLPPYAVVVAQARRRFCGHRVAFPLPAGLHPDGTPAFRCVCGVVAGVSQEGSVVVCLDDGRTLRFGLTLALEQFRLLS